MTLMFRSGPRSPVALLGSKERSQQSVAVDENDFDVRIVGTAGKRAITLFRSTHGPVERAVLGGAFLQNRRSAIEREAVLGLYARPLELANEERARRREAAWALLEKPEAELSPEERRVVGLLRFGRAQVEMFRVFESSPPPGPARDELHRRALDECMAVCRILGPLAAADPHIDDVGMTFWATNTLAHYYMNAGAPKLAIPYAEDAVALVRAAARRDPKELEYQRWDVSGRARLAEAQAAGGIPPRRRKGSTTRPTSARPSSRRLRQPETGAISATPSRPP